MKKTSLNNLINTSITYPNYTFTLDVDKDNRDYVVRWGDIVLDLVDWNCGRLDNCTNTYINFFDENGEYVESYLLQPNSDEIMRLQGQCDYWMEVFG